MNCQTSRPELEWSSATNMSWNINRETRATTALGGKLRSSSTLLKASRPSTSTPKQATTPPTSKALARDWSPAIYFLAVLVCALAFLPMGRAQQAPTDTRSAPAAPPTPPPAPPPAQAGDYAIKSSV